MDKVARRQVALWLLLCSAMVFAILVVGGVTRLTHSGLSIVEWQPIVGVIPPLNQQEWEDTFEKYKLTPEYQQVNHRMALAEFKGIFWWEWSHRVLARLVGVVFAVPFSPMRTVHMRGLPRWTKDRPKSFSRLRFWTCR